MDGGIRQVKVDEVLFEVIASDQNSSRGLLVKVMDLPGKYGFIHGFFSICTPHFIAVR